MRLSNKSTSAVVCQDVREAGTFRERTRGLIGSAGSYGLVLETRWGIHTFGMNFPIDVFVLNRENQVIKIKKNLRPNHLFFWNPRYSKVVEVPLDISKAEVKKGDVLLFEK